MSINPAKRTPTKEESAARELGEHRPVNRFQDLVDVELGRGRVRAHAAGVRALVTVVRALEILRRRERDRVDAVAEGKHRYLGTVEQLFDHDAPAECGDRLQRVVELLLRVADEDALAGGEPVRLDDARRPRDREGLRGRDAGGAHHVLGERLRAFDPRRVAAGAEHREPVSPQRVADARDERGLGPDDDEVGSELPGKPEQALSVLRANRMTVPDLGDAGVAWRAMELGQARTLGELPRERMLAPARPHEEHLHAASLFAPPEGLKGAPVRVDCGHGRTGT